MKQAALLSITFYFLQSPLSSAEETTTGLPSTGESTLDRSCLHFTPPSDYSDLYGFDPFAGTDPDPTIYDPTLDTYSGLKNIGWAPVPQKEKLNSDVVFIFRGYGGSSLVNTKGNKQQRRSLRKLRSEHFKQIIMASLSELSFGSMRSFSVYDAGVDEETIDEHRKRIPNYANIHSTPLDQRIAHSMASKITLDSKKLSPSGNKVYVIVFHSVQDEPLFTQDTVETPVPTLSFDDGSQVKATYISYQANLEYQDLSAIDDEDTRQAMAINQYLKNRTELRKIDGMIVHRILGALGRIGTTIGGRHPLIEQSYDPYYNVSRWFADLLEPESLTMVERAEWHSEWGVTEAVISPTPRALCDSDNAVNPNAWYAVDLGACRTYH
ncbi:MAG: hypothetical protein ACR2PX_11750 [Endozoicomonas sp.]|uniref:hypothetical protein n=1 Tax=Endozoicomonas sp. TaxID=1892382 RepID=UPI003D9B8C14